MFAKPFHFLGLTLVSTEQYRSLELNALSFENKYSRVKQTLGTLSQSFNRLIDSKRAMRDRVRELAETLENEYVN
jgi:hypothetical protein